MDDNVRAGWPLAAPLTHDLHVDLDETDGIKLGTVKGAHRDSDRRTFTPSSHLPGPMVAIWLDPCRFQAE